MEKKGRDGSSLDEFLKSDGIYEEVTVTAVKRVVSRQLDAMKDSQGLTKSGLARPPFMMRNER
jgi:antitoxin HicB